MEARFESWKKDQVSADPPNLWVKILKECKIKVKSEKYYVICNNGGSLENILPAGVWSSTKQKSTCAGKDDSDFGWLLCPDLGISETDRRILAAEVQVLIHGAASVRFEEPLEHAVVINTRAVRLITQLAKEMRLLESFVHVSTAFSNCVVDQIQERFYPEHLSCPVDKVLDMHNSVSSETFEKMAPALIGKFPNTYTYTKALGEQVIQEEAKGLPVGIFRPAISK